MGRISQNKISNRKVKTEKMAHVSEPEAEEKINESQMSLQELMKSAIRAFNQYEQYLIDHNASERCSCGRSAYHLQQALLSSESYKDYVLDVEYNIGVEGDPDAPKTVLGRHVFLDIIAHKRGYDEVLGFDNLIAVEMKKTGFDFSEDKNRLAILTNSYDGYSYKAGFAVRVDRRNHCLVIDESFFYPSDAWEPVATKEDFECEN